MIATAADLIAREGAMLVLLGLLGSGPAALVPGPLPALARLALAPALGLALGFGATLSASQLMPMSTAAWVVLTPLCLASVALAWRLARRGPGPRARPAPGAVLALAFAIAVPLGVLDAPFVDQRTPGPGAYYIADAAGYANLAGALADNDWNTRDFGPKIARTGTLGNRGLHEVIDGRLFQSGTAPLAAGLNETLGLSAVDGQSSFMAVLVVIGALGCFALVFAATSSALGALTAALLFAGPVAYQLFIDGSQAPLGALALFGALAIVATRLGAAPLPAGVLLGVLGAGVAVSYPSFLPTLIVSVVLGLALQLLRRERAERRRQLRALGAAVGAAVVAAVLLAPVAIAHDFSYARAVSSGVLDQNYGEAVYHTPVRTQSFGRPVPSLTFKQQLPRWSVSAASAPAWLSGARDIYYLPDPGQAGALRWIAFDLLFPLLVLALALLALLRFPAMRPLLCAALAAALVALYAFTAKDCTYCGQRNLVPLAVVAAALAGAGVAALAGLVQARRGRRAALVVAALAAAVVLAVPLQRDSVLARRLTEGGTFLGAGERVVLDRAAAVRGLVAVEAPGAGPTHAAGGETGFFQAAAIQKLPRPLRFDPASLPAMSYLPGHRPSEVALDPAYRWVLTRLAGVKTPRATLVRRGPYALQRRRTPVDATISSGVMADLAQRDSSGSAWVEGPVSFTVSAPRARPVALRIVLRGPAAAAVKPLGAARTAGRSSGAALVCLPVPGSGETRRATLDLHFRQPPARPFPGGAYGEVLVPPRGLRIAAVTGVLGRCSGGARP